MAVYRLSEFVGKASGGAFGRHCRSTDTLGNLPGGWHVTDSPEFVALKQRMKSTWMAGDFGQIARINERSAEEFVGRLGLHPGMRVLDVACGTGNQSVPAA